MHFKLELAESQELILKDKDLLNKCLTYNDDLKDVFLGTAVRTEDIETAQYLITEKNSHIRDEDFHGLPLRHALLKNQKMLELCLPKLSDLQKKELLHNQIIAYKPNYDSIICLLENDDKLLNDVSNDFFEKHPQIFLAVWEKLDPPRSEAILLRLDSLEQLRSDPLEQLILLFNYRLKNLGIGKEHFFDPTQDPSGKLMGIKQAALKTHPDTFATESVDIQTLKTEQFKKILKNAEEIRNKLLAKAIRKENIKLASEILRNGGIIDLTQLDLASDKQRMLAAQLIRSGANVSAVPDKTLLANPAMLEASLQGAALDEERIERLLQMAPPEDISHALLTRAKLVQTKYQSETEAPPEKPQVDLSPLLGDNMTLDQAEEKGLLDIPIPKQKTAKLNLNDKFFESLRAKSASELLSDYLNYQSGFTLPEDFSSLDLPEILSVVRNLISEKIDQLSESEKQTFSTTAGAAQFAGALEFAHRRGITGDKVKIAILEPMAEADYQGTIGKTAKVASAGEAEDSSHGYLVTGLVQQVAPDSPIQVQWGQLSLKWPKIINCSLGTIGLDETSPKLKAALESGKLVIKSSGNKGKSLDLSQNDPNRNTDQNFLSNLPPEQLNRLILSGNLETGNVPAHSSDRPGSNERLQDRFLWTLGSDVLSRTGPGNALARKTGTSMSAPIVTGAAALVQSFWEDATPEQVSECLLESADRDFWIHKPGMDIHVTPSDESGGLSVGNTTARWPFDKKIFGMGVLNIRRALEYAHLKKNYNLSPDAIREVLAFKEKQAAIKIQKFVRKFSTKIEPKQSADKKFVKTATTPITPGTTSDID